MTTNELAEAVAEAICAKSGRTPGHPLTYSELAAVAIPIVLGEAVRVILQHSDREYGHREFVGVRAAIQECADAIRALMNTDNNKETT